MLPGALLAVAALLAGCSASLGGPDTNGPLGDGGTPGGQCVPSPAAMHFDTMGIFDLDDAGKSPVKVTGITLAHNHGLAMTSAWLTPIGHSGGDEELIGAAISYPPSYDQLARQEWARRQKLIGAVIRPRQDLNLVFGLAQTTAKAGSSSGPRITYTSSGNRYVLQEQTTLEVAPRGHC
jgi:hypothetical protein